MERGITRSLGEALRPFADMRGKTKSAGRNDVTRRTLTKSDVLRLYSDCAGLLGHRSSDREFHKTLIGLSKGADYVEGREIVIGHSNSFLSERCGMAKTTFTDQLRKHDGRTIRRRLGGNGHRFVVRRRSETHDGEVLYHNGISLEPMIEKLLELVPMVEAQAERRTQIGIAKARASAATRRQREAMTMVGDDERALTIFENSKATAAQMRKACQQLDVDEAERIATLIVKASDEIDAIKARREASEPERPTSQVSENRHHLPLQTLEIPDSVMLGEEKGAIPSVNIVSPPDYEDVWRPAEIARLFPTLRMFIAPGGGSDWTAISAAATSLSKVLKVNHGAWDEARKVMGLQGRIVAIALVGELESRQRIITSAGHYFGGMLKKAKAGELDLQKSVWRIRADEKRAGTTPGR